MTARSAPGADGPVVCPDRTAEGGATTSTPSPAPERETESAEAGQRLDRLLDDWSEQLGAHFG